MENFNNVLSYEQICEYIKEAVENVKKIRYDNDCLDKPKNMPESKFTQMVTARLNSVLRKQRIMPQAEAVAYYNNINILHSKICEILDIIDYINSNEVMYIIDKQTVCAYLRITVATYQFFLTDISVDEEIQMEFNNVEEMLISTIQQGSEMRIRDGQAVQRRLQMKGEFGGNDVEFHKRSEGKIISVEISEAELQKKLNTNYNFAKLLDGKKEE